MHDYQQLLYRNVSLDLERPQYNEVVNSLDISNDKCKGFTHTVPRDPNDLPTDLEIEEAFINQLKKGKHEV